jgi:O-antigen/teichoic acid export membrane protein
MPLTVYKRLFSGSLRIFLAEALLLPTGFLTVIYLTRQLSPSGYGLYSLTLLIVTWIGWAVMAIFGQATVKLISDAENWQAVATSLLRFNLIISSLATSLLCLGANSLANLFDTPSLSFYLTIAAFDIPLFTLARLHQNILIGTEGAKERATIAASYWLSRFILIVIFVYSGWGVTGAILGSLGASLISLGVSRCYIAPSVFSPASLPAQQLWHYVLPLFLSTICLRLYNTIDLAALKLFGGTTAEVGVYAATQNLALILNVFAFSFSPLLLATLSRLYRNGDREFSRTLSRQALRLTLLLLPIVGLLAGSASEILAFIYDERYQSGAILLGWVMLGACASVMISVAIAILTAIEQPRLTVILTAPLLPLAALLHALLTARWLAVGAAMATASCSCFGAIALVLAIRQILHVSPPLATLGRSIIIGTGIYFSATLWPVSGFWLLFKLLGLTILLPLAFFALGELHHNDLQLAKSLLPQFQSRQGK